MQTFIPDTYPDLVSNHFFQQLRKTSSCSDAGDAEGALSNEDRAAVSAPATHEPALHAKMLWDSFTPESYKALLSNFVQSEQGRSKHIEDELAHAWTRVEHTLALNKQRAAFFDGKDNAAYTQLRQDLAKMTFWTADSVASHLDIPLLEECSSSRQADQDKDHSRPQQRASTNAGDIDKHNKTTDTQNADDVGSRVNALSMNYTTASAVGAGTARPTRPYWLRRLFTPFLQQRAQLPDAFTPLLDDIRSTQRDALARLEERLTLLRKEPDGMLRRGAKSNASKGAEHGDVSVADHGTRNDDTYDDDATRDATSGATTGWTHELDIPVYRPFELLAHLLQHLAREDIPSRALLTTAHGSSLTDGTTTNAKDEPHCHNHDDDKDTKTNNVICNNNRPSGVRTRKGGESERTEYASDESGHTREAEPTDGNVSARIIPTAEETMCHTIRSKLLSHLTATAAEMTACGSDSHGLHCRSHFCLADSDNSLTDSTSSSSTEDSAEDNRAHEMKQRRATRTTTASPAVRSALASQRMWFLIESELHACRIALRAGLQRCHTAREADQASLRQLYTVLTRCRTCTLDILRNMDDQVATLHTRATQAEQHTAKVLQCSESAYRHDRQTLREGMARCAIHLHTSATQQERLTRQLRQIWKALCAEQQRYILHGQQMLQHQAMLARLDTSHTQLCSLLRRRQSTLRARVQRNSAWQGWLSEARGVVVGVLEACVRHVDRLSVESGKVLCDVGRGVYTQAQHWLRCLSDVRILYLARDQDMSRHDAQDDNPSHGSTHCSGGGGGSECGNARDVNDSNDHTDESSCYAFGTTTHHGKEGEDQQKEKRSWRMDFIANATRERVTQQLRTLRQALLDFDAHYAEVETLFHALHMSPAPRLTNERDENGESHARCGEAHAHIEQERVCMRRIDANWRRNGGRRICAKYRTPTPVLTRGEIECPIGKDTARRGVEKTIACVRSLRCPAGAGVTAAVHLATQR